MIQIIGSSTIELRNPAFGDVRRRNTNAIIRHTRAGELKTVRPTTWFNTDSLSFTFTRLKQSKMQDFRDLMIADAGQEFLITRLEGITSIWTYTGYIISPIFDIIRVKPPCSYDLSFDFQVKVP